MKFPNMSSIVAILSTLYAAFSLLPNVAAAQSPALSIFEVPIGAAAADVEAMAASQGVIERSPTNRCIPGRLCSSPSVIERIPGTEFVSTLWGNRTLPDRTLAFSFAFTAPPNAHRVWAAGSDQTFGNRYAPSGAAPLLTDVLAELRARFGEPSRYTGAGGAAVSSIRDARAYWWIWSPSGQQLRWDHRVHRDCDLAMAKSAVLPGNSGVADRNSVAVDPEPFFLARRANCAQVVRAEFGHTNGLVYALSVRIADFEAGHDAYVQTRNIVLAGREESNRQRSTQNRPRF